MKTRPILFSGPMVRALLAGTKTQTRRVVKPPKEATVHKREWYPDKCHADNSFNEPGVRNEYLHVAYGGGDLGRDVLKSNVDCPYGAPGDRLWVRETYALLAMKEGDACVYRASCDDDKFLYAGAFGVEEIIVARWRPSIFMRPALSRITLEITAVRAERVGSISEADAVAEGVEPYRLETWSGYDPKTESYPEFFAPPDPSEGIENVRHHVKVTSAVDRYAALWNQINGKTKPWAVNPWVWVVEFRRVKP